MHDDRSEEFDELTLAVAKLNDAFRSTFNAAAGHVVATSGFNALPENDKRTFVGLVQSFNAFDEENDPGGEHDFGRVEHGGEEVFWKIDYYDKSVQWASPDPSDPDLTHRVLTLMLANEY